MYIILSGYNSFCICIMRYLHDVNKEKFKIFRSWFTITNTCDVHLQVYMPLMKHDMHDGFFNIIVYLSLYKWLLWNLIKLIKIVNPVNTIDWGGGGWGVVVVLLSPVSKQSNNLSSPKIKKTLTRYKTPNFFIVSHPPFHWIKCDRVTFGFFLIV